MTSALHPANVSQEMVRANRGADEQESPSQALSRHQLDPSDLLSDQDSERIDSGARIPDTRTDIDDANRHDGIHTHGQTHGDEDRHEWHVLFGHP